MRYYKYGPTFKDVGPYCVWDFHFGLPFYDFPCEDFAVCVRFQEVDTG